MSESLPIISPYLNPEYWEGNMLGAGQPEPFPRFASDFRSASSAIVALSETISQAQPSESQRDLAQDQTFASQTYWPGTVVLLRQETLFAAGKVPDLTLLETDAVSLPARRTDLSAINTTFDVPTPDLLWQNIVYRDQLLWGVVTETKKGLTVLETIPDNKIIEQDNGRIAIVSLPICHDGEFTIGETKHRKQDGRRALERLERINALKIVASGQPPRNERKGGKTIGGLLLRPSTVFGL